MRRSDTVEVVRGVDSPLSLMRVATCSACRKPTWVAAVTDAWRPVACEVCARDLREPALRRWYALGAPAARAPTGPPPPPPPKREGFWAQRRRRRAEGKALASVASTVRKRAETVATKRAVADERAEHLRRWEVWDEEDGLRIASELRADLAVLYPDASDASLDALIATFKQRTRDGEVRP